jgi:hypothetical protein
MAEEQDVHADHDGYQREHVKHDACLPSHRSTLVAALAIALLTLVVAAATLVATIL